MSYAEITGSDLDYIINTNLKVVDEINMVLVIILQCETKQCDPNVRNLKWAFSDHYFTVQVCSIDLPSSSDDQGYNQNNSVTAESIEIYNMKKLLTYSAEGPYADSKPQSWWDNIPTIIVKDSSLCSVGPADMKNRIKKALELGKDADLFYLCKWDDTCSKYRHIGEIDSGTKLKWSTKPTSTQCIMYTPKARDYVRNRLDDVDGSYGNFLNSLISSKQLTATVFSPNIVDYDIDLATSTSDYAKLSECSQHDVESTTNFTLSTYIWLSFILLLIVIVAWILVKSI